MEELTLLVDCHYLCWRAYYTTGHLTHGLVPTGVIYGFLREIKNLIDRFYTEQIVFCFDSIKSKREALLSTYKSTRKKKVRTEDEQVSLNQFSDQIRNLRDRILPNLGYKNIFRVSGYEADDLIADIAINSTKDFVIVSGDADLYQLLNNRISIYNPRGGETTTARTFRKKFRINPREWVSIKAMAGCSTDDITGIKGVGEKTAIKYIKGELDAGSAAFKKIISSQKLIEKNTRLVKLPFEGCPRIEVLQQPATDLAKWREVLESFGIDSLKESHKQGRLFDG